MIELIEDDLYYILKSRSSSLWCSKIDGSFSVHQSDDIMKAVNPTCLGLVYALIGKFRMGNDGDWKLLLVKKVQEIGTLPPRNTICFKITQILVLTLNLDDPPPKDSDVEPCPKHKSSSGNMDIISNNIKNPLQKKWNQFMNAAENIKHKKLANKFSPITQMISGVTGNISNNQKDAKDKFEKKVIEELYRMFNESDSFYFSPYGDLTNNTQNMQDKLETCSGDGKTLWKLADDHYFWNSHMLNDIIKLSEHNELANEWILPIIQGYVQIEECPIKFEDEDDFAKLPSSGDDDDSLKIKMAIVSRRSRFRTGTRYKRRGIDGDGHTANFVETEQILEFLSHVISFTQIRGSIPLYWSQSGIKYRPLPRIEKDFDQNHEAFTKHMTNLMERYGDVKIINLIDQDGREKVIGDALLQHIIAFNHPELTYITFDFHDYCQGMKFENVGILIENTMKVIEDMKYCWVDKNGLICKQKGIFRVNCMDCLDRTNIVQSALARIILEMQFRKLGLLSPERQLSGNYKSLYHEMWANNGDVISKQYAGTAALKGDYTRTGERKFTGVMKDGVNSANRYFINQVKDVYRQATMDLLQGNTVAWDSLDGSKLEGDEMNEGQKEEEDLKNIIEDCQTIVGLEPYQCLGGWGLVNCEKLADNVSVEKYDYIGSHTIDVNIILLLSETSIFVAHYDDFRECVTNYQKIDLEAITFIELGFTSFAPKLYQLCFRIHYNPQNSSNENDLQVKNECHSTFYTFCLPGAKLLNSRTGSVKNADDIKDNLMSIIELITATCKAGGKLIKIEMNKINCQIKSKHHQGLVTVTSQARKMVDSNLLEPLGIASISNFSSNKNPMAGSSDIEPSNTLGNILESDALRLFKNNLFDEHPRRAEHSKMESKELIRAGVTCQDHVCLSSCGILVIRSKNQLKLGLIREAESFHYFNVSNYFETIRLLRQISETGMDENEATRLKKSSMLCKNNKSKSLDSSAMLQKMKQIGIRPKNSLSKMTALAEEQEASIADNVGCDETSGSGNNLPTKSHACKKYGEELVRGFEVIEHDSSDIPPRCLLDADGSFHALSQMKNSKSENSFVNKSTLYFSSNPDDFDFLEQPTSSTALSKFKKKFIQLTLLSQQVGTPQMIHERQTMELEQMKKRANCNSMRSKLRFQFMKSDIILL